jgi:hypothetical protein
MPHPAATTRAARTKALLDPASFAATLIGVAIAEFGLEACTWDHETITLEVEQAFGVTLPHANRDRLLMGAALHASDRFYKDLPSFVLIAPVLNGAVFDPRVLDLPDAAGCAWAVTEGLLLCPPEPGDDEPFCREIRLYLGKVLDDEGIMTPPDVLAIAIRDEHDKAARVRATYAHDPATLRDIERVEAAKTDEINDIVREGLKRLLDQLRELRLDDRDANAALETLHHP